MLDDPWIFFLFLYFFCFFSTVNSTWADKWKEISKTFIEDKGLVRDEDFIYAARNYLRLLEKIKKVIRRRINPARVIWSEDMFASCRA